jgi:hypothetical protein
MGAFGRAVMGALTVAALAGAGWAAEFHVTPSGTPAGDGSELNPWDLQTALLQPAAVKPGDTIWVHGGKYVPNGQLKVHLQGEPDKPIIVRNWKDERVTLNAPLDIASAEKFPTKYCWIWGMEIQTAGTKNPGNPMNIGNSQFEAGFNPGIKIINCVAHDCPGNGLGCWGSSEEEVYGCVIFNNGSDGNRDNPDERGHGHGFYIQSKTHKEFRDNIVFRQFFLGFQIYGTGRASMINVTMEGNTFFNNGEMSLIQGTRKEFPQIHVGGGSPIINPRLLANYVYTPAWAVKATSNIGGSENALLEDNYLVCPGADKRVAMDTQTLGQNKGIQMARNTFVGMIVGFTPDQYGIENVQIPERPATGKKVFVRKNRYEEGRANITIFNWEKSDKVDVEVGHIGLRNGDAYEVRDVQDYFGKPVAVGKYDGKPVVIPMTGLTVAAPMGRSAEYKTPPHTAPEFGAFVIMKAAETK